MIEAKKLRIGNKFLSPFDAIETVVSILDNTDRGKIKVLPPEEIAAGKIGYASEDHRKKYSHIIMCEENGNQYKPFEISGIPLTEEWLLKMGFSNKDYKPGYIGIDFKNTDFVLTYPSEDQEDFRKNFYFEFKYGGWPRLIQFATVHELQNFFFALTEEELTIKQ